MALYFHAHPDICCRKGDLFLFIPPFTMMLRNLFCFYSDNLKIPMSNCKSFYQNAVSRQIGLSFYQFYVHKNNPLHKQ